jgi:hypothetical protein
MPSSSASRSRPTTLQLDGAPRQLVEQLGVLDVARRGLRLGFGLGRLGLGLPLDLGVRVPLRAILRLLLLGRPRQWVELATLLAAFCQAGFAFSRAFASRLVAGGKTSRITSGATCGKLAFSSVRVAPASRW